VTIPSYRVKPGQVVGLRDSEPVRPVAASGELLARVAPWRRPTRTLWSAASCASRARGRRVPVDEATRRRALQAPLDARGLVPAVASRHGRVRARLDDDVVGRLAVPHDDELGDVGAERVRLALPSSRSPRRARPLRVAGPPSSGFVGSRCAGRSAGSRRRSSALTPAPQHASPNVSSPSAELRLAAARCAATESRRSGRQRLCAVLSK
jgi:hypothetical protein